MGKKSFLLVVVVALASFGYVEKRQYDRRVYLRDYRQGFNAGQWLKILGQGKTNPLEIVRVKIDPPVSAEFEVAISYDILKEHGFLDPLKGRPELKFNADRYEMPMCNRATNGNLLISCSLTPFSPGTNQVHALIWIFEPGTTARPITLSGPVFNVSTN